MSCVDPWKTSMQTTRLQRFFSLATRAALELARSYTCSFGSLTDSDRELVYRWAYEAIYKIRNAKDMKGMLTFDASLDADVARALTDTLCSSGSFSESSCMQWDPPNKMYDPNRVHIQAGVRQILELIRSIHELLLPLAPRVLCEQKNDILNAINYFFPSEEWFGRNMQLLNEGCNKSVKSVAQQVLINMREWALSMSNAQLTLTPSQQGSGVQKYNHSREQEQQHMLRHMLRPSTGYVFLMFRDTVLIDSLFDALASIVCEEMKYDPSAPANVRAIMLETITEIFDEGCRGMISRTQDSVPFPPMGTPGIVATIAPVQATRSVSGSVW